MGEFFKVFPMTFGEIKCPSINCTAVHTMINLININGDVMIEIIIAGDMAIVGPKYGTTLVTAAILANTSA